MPQESGTKHIRQSGPRKPRIHIEYVLDRNGAEEKVELPFVMGVMADLSGKASDTLPPVAQRNFIDINAATLDDRMKSIKPRVAFTVPNTVTGGDNLPVNITFESMADFSPDTVARKVEPLRKLLERREQLDRLLNYMDGNPTAEELVSELLTDPDKQAKVLDGVAEDGAPTAA